MLVCSSPPGNTNGGEFFIDLNGLTRSCFVSTIFKEFDQVTSGQVGFK